MKVKLLALIVAVVTMSTGAGAQTRVYEGSLNAGGGTDSLNGSLLKAYPSVSKVRIRTALKQEGRRYSVSNLRIDGKKMGDRYSCRRDTEKNRYFSRIIRCSTKKREKDGLFEGQSCAVSLGIDIHDDPHPPYKRYMRPYIVVTKISTCGQYWILRGWDNYVKRSS